MPIYSIRPSVDDPEAGPEWLASFGLVLTVSVGVPKMWSRHLASKGRTVPAQQERLGPVDTGASRTCIDISITRQLGLLPLQTTPVATPSGIEERGVYPVRLEFPDMPIPTHAFLRVLAVDLAGMGVGVLIGRDILQNCLMIWNGRTGEVTLAY